MTWLQNTLPELQTAEARLRADVQSRYGIRYAIREAPPHFAGLRTEADTALLLRWRNEVVATARRQAENRARANGATAAQIKAAGDRAADGAHYRVSPYGVGFHPLGGAFDIFITDAGNSAPVVEARRAAEVTRRARGGSPVQIKAAGDVAAVNKAYALVGARAPAFGLRWGGNFQDNPATPVQEKPDPYHLELNQQRAVVAQKFAQLQQLKRAGAAQGQAVLLVGVLALVGVAFWAASRHSASAQ